MPKTTRNTETHAFSMPPRSYAQLEKIRQNLIAREDWMLLSVAKKRSDFPGSKWARDFSKSHLCCIALDHAAAGTAPGSVLMRQSTVAELVMKGFEILMANPDLLQKYVNEWNADECWSWIEALIQQEGLSDGQLFTAAPDDSDRPAFARPEAH